MFRKFGPSGGFNGIAFEARPQDAQWKINRVRVWSGSSIINAIQVRWSHGEESKSSPVFGTDTGDREDFKIDPEDYLVGIQGSTEGKNYGPLSSRYYVSSLRFITKTKRSRIFGEEGDAKFRYDEVRRYQVIGFHGFYDERVAGLNALGVTLERFPID